MSWRGNKMANFEKLACIESVKARPITLIEK
jgi:hypothetical protein